MKNKTAAMALAVFSVGTVAVSETNFDDPTAIMAELSSLSEDCATIEPGSSQTHVFGIEVIRVGDTCAIVSGDELDERVRLFLEEQNLPWAGVGIWVTASDARQAD